jgi:hypothetical protein
MGEIDHRENETQDPVAQRGALCGGYLFRKKITFTILLLGLDEIIIIELGWYLLTMIC